ncbi:MAG TPA: hypothetical protein VM736_02120 [Gemmatimonadales bacterium]|nr:hypothetical protein [Gemmatimonadales bacterium]
MSFRLLVAACVVGGACASAHSTPVVVPRPDSAPTNSPAAAPAGPAPREARRSDAVRYGPSAVRYLVHRQVHRETLGSQLQVQNLGVRIFVTMAITGPADSVGYPATFSVDSIAADSGTPPLVSNSFAKVRKLVYAGRVVRRGEFVNVVASDSALAQAAAQLIGTFRDFLPRLPPDGVAPGATWADTVEMTQKSADAASARHAVLRATAAAGAPVAGLPSVRVETSQLYTVTGNGKNLGQPYELSGAGTASATAIITADGRYLGGEGRDSTSFTYRLLARGDQVPVIQVTRTTVAVLP